MVGKARNLCALLSAAIFFSVAAAAAPEINVPEKGLQFGEISVGAETSRTIQLLNPSASPVFIYSVRACCGAKASVSSMRIEPASFVRLTVSLKPAIPGRFSKQVEILCDDENNTVFTIPVTGEAVLSQKEKLSLHWIVSTVLLAGLADGFNPCAFSIVIVLAGILAAGGRGRKARLLGGLAFCASSFLTYMAMGMGLMHLVRAMEEMRLVHNILMAVLSCILFILAFLSVRDAFRYRKENVPSAIALQLPDCVKKLIRSQAEASWKGHAVVVSGFVCGFVVTLLDSLCTGQIYVPLVAFISNESADARPFWLLLIYNLAFIAPLVTLFVVSALGISSQRLSHWSKRNVFPSKIAMAFVFAALGALIMPRFGSFLAELIS